MKWKTLCILVIVHRICEKIIISEADSTNDLTSVSRKLDQKLVLLVKQKLGETEHWMMPQRPRKEGETMRQVGVKGHLIS